MAQIAKRYQDELDYMKDCVEESYAYFKENYNRFHDLKRFVFRDNLSVDAESKLDELSIPPLQFNVLEAYVSRQRGEFAKQEPSFVVHAPPDAGPVDTNMLRFVEGHLRSILLEAKNNNFESQVHTDTMTGGFSVIEVSTEYENEKSFNQKICFSRVFDPTLCGFDPMAREPHKADGQYIYKIYPIYVEDFKRDFPNIDIGNLMYTKSLAGFAWSYKAGNKDVILLCEFYKKKKKKTKLLYLANGMAVTPDEYEQIVAMFEESKTLAQAPAVIHTRQTEIQTICCYRFIENKVIDYKETIFKDFPLIFVDGNSEYLKEAGFGSATTQFTRPYIYNALDAQRLKNVAGQIMAREIENTIAHKFMVSKESVPEDYIDAYNNIQRASALVYNAFQEDGITPIPAPQAVPRAPMPQEIIQTFGMMDQLIQNILGTSDVTMGQLGDNQISGLAIIEAATQSNITAMPYITNYLVGLNQAAQVAVDLIPKVHIVPRQLPVVDNMGRKTYQSVNDNQQNSINLSSLQPGSLKVIVEAGVNFEVQQTRSLQMLTLLSQTFPALAQLINSKGLPIILDNIDVRGAEELKQLADQFMQEMAQQQAAQQGQQPQNPVLIRAQVESQKAQMNAQLKTQEMQMKNAHKQAELQLQAEQIKNEQLKTQLQYLIDHQDQLVQLDKANTEREVHHAELGLKHSEHLHDVTNSHIQHMKDFATLGSAEKP
jgi:hypothetical protein